MTATQDTATAQEPVIAPLGDLVELPPGFAFLELEMFGSSLLNWAIALLVLLLVHPLLRLVLKIVTGRVKAFARRTPNEVDEVAATLLEKTRGWVVFAVALWIASLTLGVEWSERASTLAQIAVLLQVGLWGVDVLMWAMERYRERNLEDDPGAATALGALSFLGRLAVWSIIVLMVLPLLDFQIGPALAGLGVGGIAVALAVQNILGDLFASLSIIFDRPFVIGDFIIVGEQMGNVEHVGLKTTRVRALSGEQLIFSNSDLLNSRVQNFKRMEERRVLFRFGVQYDTGHALLRQIPDVVREIVEEADNARFDRAHFADFGDSSLDFEVVYFMMVPDFGMYRDTQQQINLEMYRRFEEMGVDFAFPTRTLHLHVDGADAEIRTRHLNGDTPGSGDASSDSGQAERASSP